MRIALTLFLLLASASCMAAEAAAESNAMPWLARIVAASRQTNYAGTFVYQHGRQIETSRIAHVADGGGEYERLEVLDGPPREIIRNNENVTCYLPQTKTIVIERRDLPQFPALLPDQLSGIQDNYVAKTGERDRVAGYDCQTIRLEPRDNLRYGQDFCVDLASGLPLRARTYNERNELVESFAFTQFRSGSGVSKGLLKSRYAAKSHHWRVDASALDHRAASGESGWVVKNQPPGFRKITEMRRSISGNSAPVSHIVYSDGLAAVSVFIEPLPKSGSFIGPTYQGALNIYVRQAADHMVTVVGETPARTVKQIAESFVFLNP